MSTTHQPAIPDVLVVEDSPTQAQHLARLLSGRGAARVRLAADGTAALAAITRTPPDLVISDIAMPGMDGYTLCRTLKGDSRLARIPVLLLTRLHTLQDIVRALDAGADAFICKPFDPDALLARARSLMARGGAAGDAADGFVAAERRRIYDLLVATHEQALRLNAELAAQRAGLERLLASMARLAQLSAALNGATTADAVVDAVQQHVPHLAPLLGISIEVALDDGRPRQLGGWGNAHGARVADDALHLPLEAGGGARGTLHLLADAGGLDEESLRTVCGAAQQAALALERAHLHARTQALLVERTEALRYASNYDTHTGLPNRVLLRERLRSLKPQARSGAVQVAVVGFLLLRFARLPLIRQAFGPAAEQDVLAQAATRLRDLAGQDAVGRFSEDAFALALLRRDADELAQAARRVLAGLQSPCVYEQHELHLDPCIGIAVYPNDGEHYEQLASGAEAALRLAARGALQRYAFYRPELNQGADQRFRLESALRRAVQAGELVLHYQPQVRADGALVGAECLLRWHHAEHGCVPPSVFVPLAEECGLILQIGESVLRGVCAQLREWQRQGLKPVPVAVNLSAHEFTDRIVPTLRAILDEYGIDPALVELELTESASMADPDKTCELLAQLKAMGLSLAIDDFGTGYSNLSYLKRFPVDKLKLDQSFVCDLMTDAGDRAIAGAVIAMARGLRLSALAEGVETAGQLAVLTELGCELMQGFHFSAAIPAAQFARMLAAAASAPSAPLP